MAAVALLGRLDGLELETMREFWPLFLCLGLSLDSAGTGLDVVLDFYFVLSERALGLLLDGLQGMLL